MENIVNPHLLGIHEVHQLLGNKQYACRPGFGTGTYLASLGQLLDEALNEGENF